MIAVGDVAPSDFAAFPDLLAQLGYPAGGDAVAARIPRILAAGGRVLVARDEGDVLAVIALAFMPLIHHDDELCRITALVVADRARGRGIGKALVEEAERIARERGCRRIEVTSADHRAGAHAFYIALGYDEKRKRFLKRLD